MKQMKKLLSILTIMAMLFAVSTVYATDYSFGYYLKSAEYIGNNTVEAKVVLTSFYGNTADVNTNLILAVYDDTENRLLNTVSTTVNLENPFSESYRHEITQTISLQEGMLPRYRISAFLWGTSNLTPTAEMDKFNNVCYLTSEELGAVPLYSSTPMFITNVGQTTVNGESRIRITGYIGNQNVNRTFVSNDKINYIKMGTERTVDTLNGFTKGDVIQFATNEAGEICAVRHLVKFDSENTTAEFMVSESTVLQNSSTAGSAKTIIYDVDSGNSTVNTGDGLSSALISTTSGGNTVGYGKLGRIRETTSETVDLYDNMGANAQYTTVTTDVNVPVYLMSVAQRDGYMITDLYSLNQHTSNYDYADDVLYIFKNNGVPVLHYAFDLNGDNY